MSFDPTTIGIIIALIGAGIFFFVEFILRKDIEVINSAIIFLAIYAISQGYLLIRLYRKLKIKYFLLKTI
uniref:Uncharacterized protein n=1 Tax=Candidatus Kentrum sp. LPFa TaxID=2126335 RepID=A0A450X3S8_9GAMM|nr:MAG: hypothetical protein BECKLPF1236A_GA0070988_103982 [Candidatus Kentron sp. LPFa]VFK35643.1 MAG: hypothetical protein BECKLPF1236C_GA0070990_104022 [Candidatus Kentron sp. LPFa]